MQIQDRGEETSLDLQALLLRCGQEICLHRASASGLHIRGTENAGGDAPEYGLVALFQLGQILIKYGLQDDVFFQLPASLL